ncbi:hypothetical protein AV530_017877 [Patagioenas fasciata monilis]|uniref:Uncharacterized protein n=1 Tax=Patagioenas fasciata monilis TaxID=372326 RepID=A0A1V4JVX9_PATFA|nr:hypothetical protein AV530_017877 [Patagioenas fasciata monilis]
MVLGQYFLFDHQKTGVDSIYIELNNFRNRFLLWDSSGAVVTETEICREPVCSALTASAPREDVQGSERPHARCIMVLVDGDGTVGVSGSSTKCAEGGFGTAQYP